MFVRQIICGATFYGIGEAMIRAEETLVVERNALVGHEFIDSFNPGIGWEKKALSEQGERFRNEMVKRNLLTDDGRIHLPGVYALLCREIDSAKVKVQFLTEIVRVDRRPDGLYEVLLHNAAGFHTVRTEAILDTTSEGLSYPPALRPVPRAKSLNVLLFNEREAAPPADLPEGMTCIPGRFPAEVIGKFNLHPGDPWPEARKKLHEYWRTRPEHLRGWTIALTAGRFEIAVSAEEVAKRQEAGWRWQPSCMHDNLLLAFDRAFAYAERGARA